MVSITVPENYGYALSAFFTQLTLQCQCNLSIANINIIQRRHCRRPRRNTSTVMDPGQCRYYSAETCQSPLPATLCDGRTMQGKRTSFADPTLDRIQEARVY